MAMMSSRDFVGEIIMVSRAWCARKALISMRSWRGRCCTCPGVPPLLAMNTSRIDRRKRPGSCCCSWREMRLRRSGKCGIVRRDSSRLWDWTQASRRNGLSVFLDAHLGRRLGHSHLIHGIYDVRSDVGQFGIQTGYRYLCRYALCLGRHKPLEEPETGHQVRINPYGTPMHQHRRLS